MRYTGMDECFIYNNRQRCLFWRVASDRWHWIDETDPIWYDDLDRAVVLVGKYRDDLDEGDTYVTPDEARAIYASIRARRVLAGMEEDGT